MDHHLQVCQIDTVLHCGNTISRQKTPQMSRTNIGQNVIHHKINKTTNEALIVQSTLSFQQYNSVTDGQP